MARIFKKLYKNKIGENMKKILFSAYTMDVGGIETALLSLLNELIKKYEITLVLEKKQGVFVNQLDKRINVIVYTPSKNKNIIIRKILNMLKRLKFIIKYKNKFDFAASYATYSKSGSFCARMASKNNCLWGHADYLTLFKNDKSKMKSFFEELEYNKFKHFIFVSNEGKESFISIFPKLKDRVVVYNNLINYKLIEEKSKKEITLKKLEEYTFLNVGRHDERQKKLIRIINVSKKLQEEGYKFKVLFIGNGNDTNNYKKLVQENELEDTILFLGQKENPYPYFNICDSVILTSDYEGYPVVFIESMVLGKPIITTDISDAKNDIEGKYGVVTEKNEGSIYEAMKKFIKNGYEIKEEFKPEEFNKDILQKIESIINTYAP